MNASIEVSGLAGFRKAWARIVTTNLRNLLRAEVQRLAAGYDSVIERAAPPLFPLFEDAELKSHFPSEGASPADANDGRIAVLIHGALSHAEDLHRLLAAESKQASGRLSLFLTGFNPYLLNLAANCASDSLRPSNFVTRATLTDIARVNGFELVRIRSVGYLPLPGLEILNSLLAAIPLVRKFACASVVVLRRIQGVKAEDLRLSVIMPVRNERGNVRTAVEELLPRPELHELLFVEGNSDDGTWEEVLSVRDGDSSGKIKVHKQPGRGKWDAVVTGMNAATGNAVVILDGDLTVAPGDLSRFSDALCTGYGDFVNGDRLVYPMEDGAMRPLNRLGNICFAKWVAAVIDVPIGDSLCGTKMMWADDVRRFLEWQRRFGAKDPFGDFSLLFAAGSMGYRIIDVPVHYKARVYGSTNIRRFRDGFLLCWFTLCGLFSVRAGARPHVAARSSTAGASGSEQPVLSKGVPSENP